jgi:hypothetical protein
MIIKQVLCILLLLYLLYLLSLIKYKETFSSKTNSMVCCVYNEDITWIHNEIQEYDKIYIYVKNKQRINKLKNEFTHTKINIILLENIGSCDHVYLYHIINNYDSLEDTITFCKGTYINKINKYTYTKKTSNNNALKSFKLNNWNFTYNTHSKYYKSEFNNLEEYLLSIFSKKNVDKLFSYSTYVLFGGYFTVTKDNIRRYNKNVYNKLINYDIKQPNREIDHYHERIWGLLFSNYSKINFN